MAELLRGNGDLQKMEPKGKNQGFTWDEIRTLLGDSVRLVPLDKNRVLLVQEEPSRQVINAKATALVSTRLLTRKPPADQASIICGDVLVVTFKELRLARILAQLGPVF
jgi:hypothetical protein